MDILPIELFYNLYYYLPDNEIKKMKLLSAKYYHICSNILKYRTKILLNFISNKISSNCFDNLNFLNLQNVYILPIIRDIIKNHDSIFADLIFIDIKLLYLDTKLKQSFNNLF